MSKNGSWYDSQNPLAEISSLASSLKLLLVKVCPVNGCNCGLIRTSLQHSLNNLAVTLRRWLWRNETKPPFLQLNACSTLNEEPHSQTPGSLLSCQPYLIRIRFQNCCFVRVYPSSLIGRVVSHSDACFSLARSFSLRWFSFIWPLMFCNYFSCLSRFSNLICSFLLFRSSSTSNWGFWILMLDFKTSVMAKEYWCSDSVKFS